MVATRCMRGEFTGLRAWWAANARANAVNKMLKCLCPDFGLPTLAGGGAEEELNLTDILRSARL